MNHEEEERKTLLYSLAISIDLAEYSSLRPSYCVEDVVVDELASYLYSLRYVAHVDIRRSLAGASRPPFSIQQRSSR